MQRAQIISYRSRRQAQPKHHSLANKIRSSARWTRLSILKRKTNPLCERCEAMDKTTAATEVNHKIPIEQRPDLAYTWTNLESICRPCHEIEEKKANSVPSGEGGSNLS